MVKTFKIFKIVLISLILLSILMCSTTNKSYADTGLDEYIASMATNYLARFFGYDDGNQNFYNEIMMYNTFNDCTEEDLNNINTLVSKIYINDLSYNEEENKKEIYNLYSNRIDNIKELERHLRMYIDDDGTLEEYKDINPSGANHKEYYLKQNENFRDGIACLINLCMAVESKYETLEDPNTSEEPGNPDDTTRSPNSFETAWTYLCKVTYNGQKVDFFPGESFDLNQSWGKENLESSLKMQNTNGTYDRAISKETKDTLVNEAKNHLSAVQSIVNDGYLSQYDTSNRSGFDIIKELLTGQLQITIDFYNMLEETGQLQEGYNRQDVSDQIEDIEDELSISGTVVMSGNSTGYNGNVADPIQNPDAYRPQGTSEDAERLKEIGRGNHICIKGSRNSNSSNSINVIRNKIYGRRGIRQSRIQEVNDTILNWCICTIGRNSISRNYI